MMKERSISLPFTIDPYGGVGYTTSTPKMWDDRVASVIGTATGMRVQRPAFGLSVTTLPFSTRSEMVESLRQGIASAFATYLPSLTLISTEVSTESDVDVVTVRYQLPNLDEATSTVSVGTVALNGSNPLSEVQP